MLQTTINNSSVESFLYKKFNGDTTLITNFINDFLLKHLPLNKEFEDDKKAFEKTYNAILQGKASLVAEKDADQQIDNFIKTL